MRKRRICHEKLRHCERMSECEFSWQSTHAVIARFCVFLCESQNLKIKNFVIARLAKGKSWQSTRFYES
ncbi:hypothetical protein [Helicobacter sp. 23-1045]